MTVSSECLDMSSSHGEQRHARLQRRGQQNLEQLDIKEERGQRPQRTARLLAEERSLGKLGSRQKSFQLRKCGPRYRTPGETQGEDAEVSKETGPEMGI